MGEFTLRIAGHTASVRTLFESTRYYCQAYLAQETAEFSLEVLPSDLEAEQALLLEEALREGIRPRNFPDPFLERSVIQRKLAGELLSRGVMLLHGSVVAVDGQGYLFTANCGTGKSTHTRLWRQVFGSRAVMINDDKPFLIPREGEVLVCGSPWSGKHGLDTNLTVPLKGICILERGAENRIRPILAAEALPMLEKQSGLDAAHPLMGALVQGTALWQMQCNKDPQAAEIAYGAMGGGQCPCRSVTDKEKERNP